MSENSAIEAPVAARPIRKDYTNLRNRPFLVINTIQRPVNRTLTGKKGWTENPANWSMFENPFVVDRVSNKIMREATVIIDIMRSTTLKSRYSGPNDDEVTGYYLEKYKNEVKEAIDIWLSRLAQRMQADPNFAKADTATQERIAAKLAGHAGLQDFTVVADEAPAEIAASETAPADTAATEG